MKRISGVIIFIILSAICYSQQHSDYRPAAFTDTGRIKRMHAAFPVIEKLYKDHAAKSHFPAMSFGIVADGKLLWSGSFGYTDVAKRIPATPTSVFRIASMSKSFTAMGILMLRDAGKLNLDDPAWKYIPEMKNIKYLTSDAPPITIRHLLTHSGGFPEDNPWGDRQLADTDAELLKVITNGVGFSNVPGIGFEYSNLGFALLGKIISNVAGMPYQQYINKNIFQPLGMQNTYWEYSLVPGDKLAHGYRWINQQWREEALLHDGSYGAMGGMITSIEDFSRYIALHLSAWPPKNERDNGPLQRSSIREMHQPWQFTGFNFRYKYPNGPPCAIASGYGYGLGWSMDCENRTIIEHSGGLPGFGSQWTILPEYGIGVVSFANVTYAGTSRVNRKVLDTLIVIAGLKPMQLPVSSILNNRKNDLIQLLPGWAVVKNNGIFAENFFEDNPIDYLRKEAMEIFANAGKILRVTELYPENNLRGRFIMEGERKNIEIFFTLTPENPPLIQEYHIREINR